MDNFCKAQALCQKHIIKFLLIIIKILFLNDQKTKMYAKNRSNQYENSESICVK